MSDIYEVFRNRKYLQKVSEYLRELEDKGYPVYGTNFNKGEIRIEIDKKLN